MIKFKKDELEGEWKELEGPLKAIGRYISFIADRVLPESRDIIITGVNRTREEQEEIYKDKYDNPEDIPDSLHQHRRAFDFRRWQFKGWELKLIKKMVETHFEYGGNKPIVYIEGNHIHVQLPIHLTENFLSKS